MEKNDTSNRPARYHFVRVADKDEPDNGTWLLAADSEEVIMDHWTTYCAAVMKEGMQQIVGTIMGTYRKHYTNYWAGLVHQMVQIKGGHPAVVATELENEALATRLKSFRDGHEIYLNKIMGVVSIVPPFTIVEEDWSDKLLYPDERELDLSNVRYIQWPGGEHWYAKVGSLDIVDEFNRQKWDTKAEAEKAARWFLSEKN